MRHKREYYLDKESNNVYFVDICLGVNFDIINKFKEDLIKGKLEGLLILFTISGEEHEDIVIEHNNIYRYPSMNIDIGIDNIFEYIISYTDNMQKKRKQWSIVSNTSNEEYEPFVVNITDKYTRQLKLERILKQK